MQEYLPYISGYSALLPFIIGIFYWEKLPGILKWMLAMVGISLVADLISFDMVRSRNNSIPAVHAFFILQAVIGFLIFHKADLEHSSILNMGRIFTAGALTILSILLWDEWASNQMNVTAALVSSGLILTLSILYLIDFAFFRPLSTSTLPPSLSVFGALFIYHASIMAVLAAYSFINFSVFNIKLATYIFFNIALSIIFILESNER